MNEQLKFNEWNRDFGDETDYIGFEDEDEYEYEEDDDDFEDTNGSLVREPNKPKLPSSDAEAILEEQLVLV